MAEDPTEQASSDLPEAAGARFFEHFLAMYIEPDVERRISRGEWQAGAPIVLAQVLFKLGRPAEVRLNAEVRGELQAVASGSFEKR